MHMLRAGADRVADLGDRGLVLVVTRRLRGDVDLPEAVSPGSVRGMTRRVEQALPAVVAALTPPVLSWAQRATMDLTGPSR